MTSKHTDESDYRLTPGELGRLAYARHEFWCISRHHQSPFCIEAMSRGVDAQGISREQDVIEEIVRGRVADVLDRVADDPAYRLRGHSGVSVNRLRQRASALRLPPGSGTPS